jgi:hypothetical protein
MLWPNISRDHSGRLDDRRDGNWMFIRDEYALVQSRK